MNLYVGCFKLFFAGALEANDISVWVDESGLTAGAVYLREIGEAIVASKLFIILLSTSSVQSKYCQVCAICLKQLCFHYKIKI